MQFPQRLKYTYVLKTKLGNVKLSFMQSSINETDNEQETLTLRDFLKKLKVRTVSYEKKWYVPKRAIWNIIKDNIIEIHGEIYLLRNKVWKSIYKDEDNIYPKDYRRGVFNNIDTRLAEKCNCDIQKVRDTLTYEQLGYLLDEAKREFYESFDGGKAVNDTIRRQKNGLSNKQRELLEYMKGEKTL